MVNSNKSIPSYEKALNDEFQKIYQELSQLKNNRNKYINSKQVYIIYDSFLSLLHDLTLTRKDEELKGISLSIPNGNDLIIDDIWQLLSLCFLTCGLIKFAPATYSSLSTVNKLLSHLKECQVYTMEDLRPIKERLDNIKEIISNSETQTIEEAQEEEEFQIANGEKKIIDDNGDEHSIISHKREESLLLRNKLNKCQQVYNELEESFKSIPSDLKPFFNELIKIRKSLLNYLTNDINKSKDVTPVPESTENPITQYSNEKLIKGNELSKKLNELKTQLKIIESKRNEDGKFTSEVGTEKQLKYSQMILNGLLDDCNNLINDVSIQQESSDISLLFQSLSTNDDEYIEMFKKLYNQLIELKLTLENLLITRRWTMRETDLYNYQKSLKVIDDDRIQLNNKINSKPSSSKNIKRLQILILYLLRRCYSLIYKLLESSEPVSESLQPIHNQLSTVRRCLLEIKRIDGLNNLRELYPFQFKLASLDNLRSDGKFIINNQIPEGQGTLNALLAECFDIIHELKIELEEKEEQNDDDETDPKPYTTPNSKNDFDNITDDEDINPDDEVELKRNRYVGFNEADYDQDSESDFDAEDDASISEYEDNDYY